MTSLLFSKGVLINGSNLTLESAEAIAKGAKTILAPSTRKHVEKSHLLVKRLAKNSKPIYGVNTGFGYLANKKISLRQLKKLQINLLKSHAAGIGAPLSIEETRLAMALRLNVFVKGYSGVSFSLCQAVHQLIEKEIYPVVPEFGSVGASGDLIPLATLALPLIGEGSVWYQGNIIPAAEALKRAGLAPAKLEEKEGLSLINGTQIMLAVGALPLMQALRLAVKADKITALTFEALDGFPEALNPLIHELRQMPGQIESAHQILEELKGSYLFSTQNLRKKVQDPYSLRCAPQVHGATRQALQYVRSIVETELNSVTDNPIVLADQEKILSGGNFHGEPLAMAFDFAAIAMSTLSNISERRLELMLNPNMSGLAPFLSVHPGINSGYMAVQYLSASLVNENKILANPASTDSIPGNAGIEDFVSMGMTSARKFRNIVKHVETVLAIELLAAAQAIDLQKIKKLGLGTKKTYEALRKNVRKLTSDRILSEDVIKAVQALEHI